MKKLIRSWMLFDWASQPYHTIIVTFIFLPYFRAEIVGDELQGQIIVSWMTAIAAIAIALCAPFFTAIADQGGGRKKWIFFNSVLFVIFCFGLWFESSIIWVALCFVLSYYFVEMLLVFTNAYLPEITEKSTVGKVSNEAWGIGYLGGLVVLAIYLLFLLPNPDTGNTLIGIPSLLPERYGASTGPVCAIWYVIFMIPFFQNMPETSNKGDTTHAIRNALASLRSSFSSAWKDRVLRYFFLISLLSRDALAGVFIFGASYGQAVLGWNITLIGIYGIVLNITGAIGGVLGGRLDYKYGANFVMKLSLWGFLLTTFASLSTNLQQVLFIPVAEGSILPHITFFVAGMFIGAFAGSLQGTMRGMVAPLTEGKIPTGEAFGLYGMLGRATAFIAPLLIGVFTQISQSVQYGVAPIVLLFGICLILYYKFERISD